MALSLEDFEQKTAGQPPMQRTPPQVFVFDTLRLPTVSKSNRNAAVIGRQRKTRNITGPWIVRKLEHVGSSAQRPQEIRVNFEIRELIVAGIVRPEDIESDNTIDSSKIAQARIAYGGRGQITDIQQPRYGQQVMDVLLPF
jgi:flagellar L-ring protein FlgH